MPRGERGMCNKARRRKKKKRKANVAIPAPPLPKKVKACHFERERSGARKSPRGLLADDSNANNVKKYKDSSAMFRMTPCIVPYDAERIKVENLFGIRRR